MSWIVVIWSMAASACITLALVHAFIWYRQRSEWANLLFAVTALGTASFAWFELDMMRAATPAEWASALRWLHVAVWMTFVSLAWFVRLYLGAGRVWLAWTGCVLRTLSLLANFSTGDNLNYREITRLGHILFFGESVSVAEGVWNPWMLLGQLSLWLLVIYVADAAIAVWRRGDRREAVLVGGSIVFYLLAAVIYAALVFSGTVHGPVIVSPLYFAIVAAMGYELSGNALRAVQLSRELSESDRRIAQVAEAVNVGIWVQDLAVNKIWANDRWLELFGLAKSDQLDLSVALQRVHPDDRDALRQSFAQSIGACLGYEHEYRVMPPNNGLRWIALRGGVERNREGKPVYIRGIALDITQRKQADLELQSHRKQVAHLLRVASLGELSSALAHELNQPLTAILSNAQAAQRFLAQDKFDLTEIRDVLADIVADDRRASEVIRRLRTLVKKSEFQPQPLEVNDLIQEVFKLMNADLTAHSISVITQFASGLPPILGDRVQLQQVLINLIVNAEQAMSQSASGGRTLTLRSSWADGKLIRISVADTGGGLPPGDEEKIFEPYHTTKAAGLGLGLSLSRSILTAHGGRLWAENHPGQGATFHLMIPERKEAPLHEHATAASNSISCR